MGGGQKSAEKVSRIIWMAPQKSSYWTKTLVEMLIQTDVVEVGLGHVPVEVGIRLEAAHYIDPRPFIIRQTEEVIVSDLVVSI